MLKNLVPALPLIVVITVVTGILVYWRAEQIGAAAAAPGDEPASRVSLLISYVVASLIFGVAAVVVYGVMEGRYGAAAATNFLRLGVGAAVVLSLLALVALPLMKRGGAAEYVALNLLWGLGYGWFLPRLVG